MKELDAFFEPFVSSALDHLADDRLLALERLLERPDRDILSWLVDDPDRVPSGFRQIIRSIRACNPRHRLSGSMEEGSASTRNRPRDRSRDRKKNEPGSGARTVPTEGFDNGCEEMNDRSHPDSHDIEPCFVVGLEDFALLRIGGSDASAWLQGQLSADILEITPDRSLLAAWCSEKGRVLALFRLLLDPKGEGYLMVCERWFVQRLLPRFRLFILRADVRIAEEEGLAVFGVSGPSESIRESIEKTPAAGSDQREGGEGKVEKWLSEAKSDDMLRLGEGLLIKVPGVQAPPDIVPSEYREYPRLLVIAPGTWIDAFDAPRKDQALWHRGDILAGLPRITPDSSDRLIPQALNLDRLRAVSFEKGCYVGQEIVTRVTHLGRIKNRCFIGHTKGDLRVGDRIVRGASPPPASGVGEDRKAEGAKVGTVVSAAPLPAGGSIACVALDIQAADACDLRVERIDGAEIRCHRPAWLNPTPSS